MEATTKPPEPPYVYPRQKPTDESVDRDGEILVKISDATPFMWRKPNVLVDGDVWVPKSQEFFKDWTEGIDIGMWAADQKWGAKAKELREAWKAK